MQNRYSHMKREQVKKQMTEGYFTSDGIIPVNAGRQFCIGQEVWDDNTCTWCKVKEIPGGRPGKSNVLKNTATVIVTTGKKAWTALARDLYQIAPKLTFHGKRVCYEHRETRDHYPYFCPEEQENCWDFELALNI